MNQIHQLNSLKNHTNFLETEMSQSEAAHLEAEQFISSFVEKNHFPRNPHIIVSKDDVTIEWTGKKNLDWFREEYPNEFRKNWYTPADHFVIKFSQNKKPEIAIHFSGMERSLYHGYEEANFSLQGTLEGIDENGKLLLNINPRPIEDR
ncbi:MAG: hypothetical protein KBC64_05705 [Simkaniaceae bacterium]|nr:hypothetical protein [Simkaniaceae bacterium]